MQFYVSKYCSSFNSIYEMQGRIPQRRVLIALSNLIYIYGNAGLSQVELDLQVQDLIYGSERSDYVPPSTDDDVSCNGEEIFEKLV